jgi:hypothetical protein
VLPQPRKWWVKLPWLDGIGLVGSRPVLHETRDPIFQQFGFESVCLSIGGRIFKSSNGRMLNDSIAQRFEASLASAKRFIRAKGGAVLLVTDGNAFGEEPGLHEEMFGPATLLVKCESADELIKLASELDGQLTATIHAEPEDEALGGLCCAFCKKKRGASCGMVIRPASRSVPLCTTEVHIRRRRTQGSLPSVQRQSIVSQDLFVIKGFPRNCCRSSYKMGTFARFGD